MKYEIKYSNKEKKYSIKGGSLKKTMKFKNFSALANVIKNDIN